MSSSETQGQIKGARESLNRRKNLYGMKKSKEQREEPLGTMSYETSSKRSPPFWLLIGARKTQFFLLFFTFLRATFFRPFRLSLIPTICPWVSEDGFMFMLLFKSHFLCLFSFQPFSPSLFFPAEVYGNMLWRIISFSNTVCGHKDGVLPIIISVWGRNHSCKQELTGSYRG